MISNAKKRLQQGQISSALEIIQPLLDTEAASAESLYIFAVCQRYLKQSDNAFSALKQLKLSYPMYARTYQELGHNYRLSNNPKASIESYEQAVFLNSALTASWKALLELHEAEHNLTAANEAKQQFLHLSNLPQPLVSVTSFMSEGKYQKAEKLCRDFLQKNPHHIEAMRLLANIGVQFYVLDDAEFLLESCLQLKPDYQLARFDYIRVLHKRQKFQKALEQAQILRKSEPENAHVEILFANESMAVGDFSTALSVYDGVLNNLPNDPYVHLARGHALKTVGKQDDAIEAYKASFVNKPDFGDAYWSLANLKTYRFTESELQQMQSAEQALSTSLINRFHLCFALGKAFEDREEFTLAMEHYERGNRLKKEQCRYHSKHTEKELKGQAHMCTRDLFRRKTGQGSPATDPIFIVGLPRAGSTLLEQIIASHSMVDGTLELPNILALAHRLNGRRNIEDDARYPNILHELSPEQLQKFGNDYIKDTQLFRKGAPYFIDKMPNNFRHIGLIHLILPNAKIIDARRHPMACCFSGFKQLFSEGQEFTYGLEEIGRYYKDYVELMDHWDKVLSGKILCVQYESVVADLEPQVRRILDFCDLPFEQSCLEFHKTQRSVRTASSEQVRQPIYQHGLEQWRHFEAYLDPLKAALGPAVLKRNP
jgi:tetratricopeptide (TPR) repeat protein